MRLNAPHPISTIRRGDESASHIADVLQEGIFLLASWQLDVPFVVAQQLVLSASIILVSTTRVNKPENELDLSLNFDLHNGRSRLCHLKSGSKWLVSFPPAARS